MEQVDRRPNRKQINIHFVWKINFSFFLDCLESGGKNLCVLHPIGAMRQGFEVTMFFLLQFQIQFCIIAFKF